MDNHGDTYGCPNIIIEYESNGSVEVSNVIHKTTRKQTCNKSCMPILVNNKCYYDSIVKFFLYELQEIVGYVLRYSCPTCVLSSQRTLSTVYLLAFQPPSPTLPLLSCCTMEIHLHKYQYASYQTYYIILCTFIRKRVRQL
jgi:hypothetical protein